MNAKIIKALVLSASLTVALPAGCADLHDEFVRTSGGSANDGATTPKLRAPYPPQSPFDN